MKGDKEKRGEEEGDEQVGGDDVTTSTESRWADREKYMIKDTDEEGG